VISTIQRAVHTKLDTSWSEVALLTCGPEGGGHKYLYQGFTGESSSKLLLV